MSESRSVPTGVPEKVRSHRYGEQPTPELLEFLAQVMERAQALIGGPEWLVSGGLATALRERTGDDDDQCLATLAMEAGGLLSYVWAAIALSPAKRESFAPYRSLEAWDTAPERTHDERRALCFAASSSLREAIEAPAGPGASSAVH